MAACASGASRKRRADLGQPGRSRIFRREDGSHDTGFGKRPRYAYLGIVPGDRGITLARIVSVDLVLHFRMWREREKAVQEAARNEELASVVGREGHGAPLTVSGRAGPDIDRHIENSAGCAAHQLGLRRRGPLEVQTAQRTGVARVGMVVLAELEVKPRPGPVAGVPDFGEPAPLVAEATRRDDRQSVDFEPFNVHWHFSRGWAP